MPLRPKRIGLCLPCCVLRIACCLSFLTPAAHAAERHIDPHNPPHGRFADDWAVIYLGGQKIGYSHSHVTRYGDRIQTGSRMHFAIGRAEQPIKIDMEQSTTETLSGFPVSFATIMGFSQFRNETRGTVSDGKVTLVTSQFGAETKQTLDFPAEALMSWGLLRESLLRGFKPGTSYTVKTYAPELRTDAAIPAETVVGDWEEYPALGKTRKGQRVTVTMTAPTGTMHMISWVDERGMPQRMQVPAPGIGELEMVVTDEKTALADFVPPEMFLKTTIKADRRIDRARAKRIRYKVTMSLPDMKLEPLPETEAQKVRMLPDNSMELIVERQPHEQPSGESAELAPEQRKEHLASNLMMNLDDPELKKLAELSIAGADVSDPYKLADRLRSFVTEYVEEKSLNIGFGTAGEVCRTKEGDCSEHAVLLAALGRLHGLPSRVAMGLAYVPIFGRQDDIFGYHMWTQFYIDGRWLDVDAALRETQCSPTRITFATSSLHTTGLADLSLPLLNRIGAIHVDIVEVDPPEAASK